MIVMIMIFLFDVRVLMQHKDFVEQTLIVIKQPSNHPAAIPIGFVVCLRYSLTVFTRARDILREEFVLVLAFCKQFRSFVEG